MFFLLFSVFSFGQQNLILNGNFEEYWECPDALKEIAKCKYVYNPCMSPNWQPPQWESSSDYFNACSSNPNVTPTTGLGSITPKSGDGYVGLCHSIQFGDYKEYIQLSFSEELKPFAMYHFSIFACVSSAIGWTTDFFHFKFADTLQYFNTFLSDVMTPDVVLSNLDLTDSSKWVELSFDYIAQGGEKYIIIGDFNKNSSNDSFQAFQGSDSMSGYEAYFLFDDASITLIKEAEPITFSNVFTPNGDGVNDTFELLSGKNRVELLVILNRWGNTVYESTSNFTWNGKDKQGKELPEGVYFVKIIGFIEFEGKKEHYQGMIHLIR